MIKKSLIIFIFFIILIIGCSKQIDYICPDKTIVDEPSKCNLKKENSQQIDIEDIKKTDILPTTSTKQKETFIPKQQSEQKRCPESCVDGDKCTYDFCNFETNFECVHQKLERCCGNDICELDNNECLECISDCYSCSSSYCINKDNSCKDILNRFQTENMITYFPSDNQTLSNWFISLQENTLKKIFEVYGKPKLPLKFRFIKDDINSINPELTTYFESNSNTIIFPIVFFDWAFNSYKDATMLETHETIHAVNFANCEYITYINGEEQHKESKIPLWVDEGLTMIMEMLIPYNYGNDVDRIQSRYEPQKTSTITNFEDKNSNLWKLANNPDAYGYPHARGSSLLYIWFKYNISESQIIAFKNSLFNECKISKEKLSDRKVIALWNQATGVDYTYVFQELEII